MTGDMTITIILGVLKVLAFVPAIVIHECAHGFAAAKLGDPTARNAGRLSLNPLRHVDPFGTVLLPGLLILSGAGFVFGYAKPVPYNPRYFKDVRKGEVIVGLAGPASNLLMSLVGAAIAWGSMQLFGLSQELALYTWYFGCYFCSVNLCLAFFNLLPIPPLDGSSIVAPLLSDRALEVYYQVQRYGMFILMLFVFLPYFIPQLDVLGIYLQATAGSLANLMLP
ncbi:MAG: site-2 protease family protein [Coriobacteriaceae bacterium]|nr:site-2 protease family protein [Coriobacteriaceae bacterium]